ncbi:hypothetical protein [Azonexus sp. R2A61]|uniref:hypothetical protein n=1 Tax=Azonexus sp. R2A61 TaxID=2744443 RepID=UPI001F1E05D1|nr:hypothetical protein [Azonexus sp. R2A61]
MSLLSQLQAAADNRARDEQHHERRRYGLAGKPEPEAPQPRSSHTGLLDALRKRLPVGEDAALSKAEIRELLGDIDYANTSLSGSLTRLVKAKEAKRVGTPGNYRYYRI